MSASLHDSFPLRPARVHEVCGAAATAFAAIAAARAQGPLLWIRESWLPERLNPLGLAPFLDPARLLVAECRDQTDSLATAEEALRDGAAPLVLIEITRALDLREGRRLQLAAKTGGATGLCLIPEGMGSNAAETRWRCTPQYDPRERAEAAPMRWEILKNKSGTGGVWTVRWSAEARRLEVTSAPGG